MHTYIYIRQTFTALYIYIYIYMHTYIYIRQTFTAHAPPKKMKGEKNSCFDCLLERDSNEPVTAVNMPLGLHVLKEKEK